jgi:hypothetical protein
MAPRVVELELERRQAARERCRHAVVVRRVAGRRFRDLQEARIRRSCRQSSKRSRSGREVGIQAVVIDLLPDSVVAHVLERYRALGANGLFDLQVPLLESRRMDIVRHVEEVGSAEARDVGS